MYFLPLGNKVIYNFVSPEFLSSPWMSALGAGTLISVIAAYYFGFYLILVIFLTYLPVSGFFYVPFMKFTLVADRFAYVPALLVTLALTKFLSKRKWLQSLAFIWLAFLVLRTTQFIPAFRESTKSSFWNIQGY